MIVLDIPSDTIIYYLYLVLQKICRLFHFGIDFFADMLYSYTIRAADRYGAITVILLDTLF